METKIEKEDALGTENSKESIHFGHLGMILACAVLLSGVMFMKNGFTLPEFNSAPVVQYTYEQAHAEALAEADKSDQNFGNDSQTQLAMLDPSLGEGRVAGASTGTLADLGIPSAEQFWTQSDLERIPLRQTGNSPEEILKYNSEMEALESSYDAPGIFASLELEDNASLAKTAQAAFGLGTSLLSVEVPSNFAELHKYKIINYMLLSTLAEGLSGRQDAPDPKDTSLQVFSVMEKISRLQGELNGATKPQ